MVYPCYPGKKPFLYITGLPYPTQALENFHTEALEMVRKNAAAQIETE